MTLPELTKHDLQQLREAFKMFDVENKGKVTADNLLKLMQSLGHNPTQAEEELLKDKVIDGDGIHFDFDDFIKMMREKMATSEEEAELRDAFKMFDRDGNGAIDFKELKTALKNIGENLSDEQVDKMLKEADTNGDGEIDFTEFVKMVSS